MRRAAPSVAPSRRGRSARHSHAPLAQGFVGCPQEIGEGARVVGRAHPSVDPALDQLGGTAARAHDQRQTHRECLQGRVRKWIVAGGEDKAIRRCVQRAHILLSACKAASALHSGRARAAAELLQVPVAPDDRQPEGFVRRRGERVDRGGKSLALKTRSDEKEHRIAWPAADLGPRRAAPLLPLPGMEVLQVHPVVDHVQLLRRDAEFAPYLVPHHPGIADHRA
jgi:hypothetical protein